MSQRSLSENAAPRCVSVLRFSSAGDVVLTTPVLAALRATWPTTRIVYVTKALFAPLIAHHPAVDEVLTLAPGEGVFSLAKRLRAYSPDAILDLHGKLRSKALRALLRPERVAVWVKRPFGENVPVRMGWRPYRVDKTIARRYHEALQRLVGQEVTAGALHYVVGTEEQREADAALRDLGVRTDVPSALLSPGAQWETKRWPHENFAAIARRLQERGFQVLVSGSPAEKEVVDAVVRMAPGAVSLVGKISLAALGGVIARSKLFVGNDSGPMHIARGLGVASAALFGSTDPAQFDFTGHRSFFANAPCSPCHFYGRKNCPKGHFDCMRLLEVDVVWCGIEKLLVASPVGPVLG